MPYSIDITGLTGGSTPVSYYVCDENGNNCSLLGTTPTVYVLSAFYSVANTLIIKAVDNNGCENFHEINC